VKELADAYLAAYEISPELVWLNTILLLGLMWFAAPILLVFPYTIELIRMSLPKKRIPAGTTRLRFAWRTVRLQSFDGTYRVDGRRIWLKPVNETMHWLDGWLAWEQDNP